MANIVYVLITMGRLCYLGKYVMLQWVADVAIDTK